MLSFSTLKYGLVLVLTLAVTSCAPPCGDVTITSASEWDTFAQGGCTDLTGALIVSAPGTTSFAAAASALVSVQSLWVSDNDLLESLSLPALTTVRGQLRVEQNARLASLSLPALSSVGAELDAANAGNLVLAENPALTSVELPALATIGNGALGALELTENLALETFAAPLLTRAGDFTGYGMPRMATFSLPRLAALRSFSFSGEYGSRQMEALTTIALPALHTVTTGISLKSNPALTTLEFPSLTSLGGLTVTNNGALRQCTVDALVLSCGVDPHTVYATMNDGTPNTCP